MTTIDTGLTLEDVSSISARYLFIVHGAESDDIFDGLENADVVASELLKESVEKAIDEGISSEMIVYHVFGFAQRLTVAAMTESPPAALAAASELVAECIKDLRESAKQFKRPSFYATTCATA